MVEVVVTNADGSICRSKYEQGFENFAPVIALDRAVNTNATDSFYAYETLRQLVNVHGGVILANRDMTIGDVDYTVGDVVHSRKTSFSMCLEIRIGLDFIACIYRRRTYRWIEDGLPEGSIKVARVAVQPGAKRNCSIQRFFPGSEPLNCLQTLYDYNVDSWTYLDDKFIEIVTPGSFSNTLEGDAIVYDKYGTPIAGWGVDSSGISTAIYPTTVRGSLVQRTLTSLHCAPKKVATLGFYTKNILKTNIRDYRRAIRNGTVASLSWCLGYPKPTSSFEFVNGLISFVTRNEGKKPTTLADDGSKITIDPDVIIFDLANQALGVSKIENFIDDPYNYIDHCDKFITDAHALYSTMSNLSKKRLYLKNNAIRTIRDSFNSFLETVKDKIKSVGPVEISNSNDPAILSLLNDAIEGVKTFLQNPENNAYCHSRWLTFLLSKENYDNLATAYFGSVKGTTIYEIFKQIKPLDVGSVGIERLVTPVELVVNQGVAAIDRQTLQGLKNVSALIEYYPCFAVAGLVDDNKVLDAVPDRFVPVDFDPLLGDVSAIVENLKQAGYRDISSGDIIPNFIRVRADAADIIKNRISKQYLRFFSDFIKTGFASLFGGAGSSKVEFRSPTMGSYKNKRTIYIGGDNTDACCEYAETYRAPCTYGADQTGNFGGDKYFPGRTGLMWPDQGYYQKDVPYVLYKESVQSNPDLGAPEAGIILESIQVSAPKFSGTENNPVISMSAIFDIVSNAYPVCRAIVPDSDILSLNYQRMETVKKNFAREFAGFVTETEGSHYTVDFINMTPIGNRLAARFFGKGSDDDRYLYDYFMGYSNDPERRIKSTVDKYVYTKKDNSKLEIPREVTQTIGIKSSTPHYLRPTVRHCMDYGNPYKYNRLCRGSLIVNVTLRGEDANKFLKEGGRSLFSSYDVDIDSVCDTAQNVLIGQVNTEVTLDLLEAVLKIGSPANLEFCGYVNGLIVDGNTLSQLTDATYGVESGFESLSEVVNNIVESVDTQTGNGLTEPQDDSLGVSPRAWKALSSKFPEMSGDLMADLRALITKLNSFIHGLGKERKAGQKVFNVDATYLGSDKFANSGVYDACQLPLYLSMVEE